MRRFSRRIFFRSVNIHFRGVYNRTEFLSRLLEVDSEMAGPSRLKLGVVIEDMCENVIEKEFFRSVNRCFIGRRNRGSQSAPRNCPVINATKIVVSYYSNKVTGVFLNVYK